MKYTPSKVHPWVTDAGKWPMEALEALEIELTQSEIDSAVTKISMAAITSAQILGRRWIRASSPTGRRNMTEPNLASALGGTRSLTPTYDPSAGRLSPDYRPPLAAGSMGAHTRPASKSTGALDMDPAVVELRGGVDRGGDRGGNRGGDRGGNRGGVNRGGERGRRRADSESSEDGNLLTAGRFSTSGASIGSVIRSGSAAELDAVDDDNLDSLSFSDSGS